MHITCRSVKQTSMRQSIDRLHFDLKALCNYSCIYSHPGYMGANLIQLSLSMTQETTHHLRDNPKRPCDLTQHTPTQISRGTICDYKHDSTHKNVTTHRQQYLQLCIYDICATECACTFIYQNLLKLPMSGSSTYGQPGCYSFGQVLIYLVNISHST